MSDEYALTRTQGVRISLHLNNERLNYCCVDWVAMLLQRLGRDLEALCYRLLPRGAAPLVYRVSAPPKKALIACFWVNLRFKQFVSRWIINAVTFAASCNKVQREIKELQSLVSCPLFTQCRNKARWTDFIFWMLRVWNSFSSAQIRTNIISESKKL